MANKEINKLASAVLDGDSRAFDRLYAEVTPRIRSILTKRGVSDVDDLCQQVWLRVISNLEKYDRGRNFLTWVFAITTNLSIDNHRRVRVYVDLVEEPALGVEQTLLDFLECLDQCMRSLCLVNPKCGQVISMRYLENMSVAEIELTVGITNGAVRGQIRNAKQFLRKCMNKFLET